MSQSYVHGASSTPLSSKTIGAALDATASSYAERLAVVSKQQGARYTYRELRSHVDRVASGLIALGLHAGDRIAIWSHNRIEWVITQYASAKVGCMMVCVDPRFRALELQSAIAHSAPALIVVGGLVREGPEAETDSKRIEAVLDNSKAHVVCFDEDPRGRMAWSELCAMGDRLPDAELSARQAQVECGDAAAILYTSGTTSASKAAVMSHHSILNSAFFIAERLRYTEKDIVCIPVPLFHSFGCILGVLAAVTRGACITLPSDRFDVRQCLEAIEQERCTALYGVPSMFSTILHHHAFRPSRVQSLRTGIIAGAPCSPSLMADIVGPMHMPEVTVCYGMTETGTLFQSCPEDSTEHRIRTVGKVHTHMECKLVEPTTGRIVPRGTVGEVWARGYATASGYWSEGQIREIPAELGRWFRTGDLAMMHSNGYLSIVGRLKEVVIAGGQNVYPVEVEEVIRSHPGVTDVAVGGVPDAAYGEAVCAWVQVRKGESVLADEIRRFCRARLADYKVPRHIRFVDDFPRTTSGKLQRLALTAQFMQS